jgi:hypothetical protein
MGDSCRLKDAIRSIVAERRLRRKRLVVHFPATESDKFKTQNDGGITGRALFKGTAKIKIWT